ncbi:MAG: hypothetical protein KIT31_16675, partial [Deltaproteobacteria bacterium]|nr:hypothetical protein [Deltaproteobacteria bacterium]
RAASAAASAAAATTAMPGELEDLGGSASPSFVEEAPLPDEAELGRLRVEVEQRKAEMTKSMSAARAAAQRLADEAKAARDKGNTDEAAQLDRRSDAERARMHALLAELATLDTELAELERVRKAVADAPRTRPPPPRRPPTSPGLDDLGTDGWSAPAAAPRSSIDDALSALKRKAATSTPGAAHSTPPPSSSSSGSPRAAKTGTVEDELAALKRKMAAAPPKKK